MRRGYHMLKTGCQRPRGATVLAMRNGDLEILEEIIQSGGGFGHREHLELAWTYLRVYPMDEAASVMTEAVRHDARRHGAEDKYHETITRAWLRFVAVHMQRWGAESFEAFLTANPDLLDRTLIEHFYSPGLIFGRA
jgi:hypothetical protein